jgi:hypothetical protein
MDRWLWLAAAVSLALSVTPWGEVALYPFKLFTTWVHECGHAAMTVLVGGSVASIAIRSNTSGLTLSHVPAALLSQGLVASAGYLGASVVGCLLLRAARVQKWAKPILLTVGALMGVTVVLWIRNLFGIVVVAAWALFLIIVSRRATSKALRFILSLLAIQVALNAVFDIRVLFLIRGQPSDADTMARLFTLPSWFWAGVWMTVSVLLFLWTIGVARLRSR